MTTKPATSAPASNEAFIPHVQTGAVDHDPRWPLPIREQLLIFVSPGEWQLDIETGEVLPILSHCRIKPGVAGTSSKGDASGMLAAQIKWGRALVPVDIEAKAFGGTHRGYNRRLETRITDSKGNPEYHHCFIWQRPVRLGAAVYFDEDRDGKRDLQRRVARDVLKMDPPRNMVESIIRTGRQSVAVAKTRDAKHPRAVKLEAALDKAEKRYLSAPDTPDKG